ncbi:hypothetical protein HYFRA_00000480 [Hymenoscyphus fraxineus]|uniref:Uncharacterized protein n=1 Tax=Hymenoscyphus fraxineus TaxID=746836 RepID=A0A9N9L2X0_9HELO|nr:hypothetical protein HYFRA_00000480 [Hymenoscyphus fraxineus]
MLSYNVFVAFAIFSTLVAGVPLPESQYRPSIHHVVERGPLPAIANAAKSFGNAVLRPFMRKTPMEKAVVQMVRPFERTPLERTGRRFRKAGKAIKKPFKKAGKAIKKPFTKTRKDTKKPEPHTP